MSMKTSLPSDVGQRLLHVTIDKIAAATPDRAWASIPKSKDLSDGYRDVSFATFANAINRMSWFLKTNLQSDMTEFRTVAYIGLPDMRYHIMSMAAAKTQLKILFSSHMHSLAGHLNLLENCDCDYLVSAQGFNVDDILSARQMKHFSMPELDELIDDQADLAPKYPYEKTFDQAKLDTYLILHTSGSTGLPKPMFLNHAWSAAHDAQSLISDKKIDGRPLWLFKDSGVDAMKPVRDFAPSPPFHGISSVGMMIRTVFGNTVLIFGPRDHMATPQEALAIMEAAGATKALLTPGFVEELANTPGALEKLARLDELAYGGGVVSQPSGSKIATVTRLTNCLGSTESGVLVSLQADREDWQYFPIAPDHNGIEWRPEGDDLYEMVIVRKPDTVRYQATFATYPDLDEWPTRDLWSKHPTKAHHWLYRGRLDDLICYADGNKYQPFGEETRLCSHPLVKAALMVGSQRRQPALLLELREQMSADEALERLWPTIAEGNATAPSVGQIARTHVLFTSQETKPFVRAVKGTVQRVATADLFREEIDGLYARHGDRAVPLITRVNV